MKKQLDHSSMQFSMGGLNQANKSSNHLVNSPICFPHNPKTVQLHLQPQKRKTTQKSTQGFTPTEQLRQDRLPEKALLGNTHIHRIIPAPATDSSSWCVSPRLTKKTLAAQCR